MSVSQITARHERLPPVATRKFQSIHSNAQEDICLSHTVHPCPTPALARIGHGPPSPDPATFLEMHPRFSTFCACIRTACVIRCSSTFIRGSGEKRVSSIQSSPIRSPRQSREHKRPYGWLVQRERAELVRASVRRVFGGSNKTSRTGATGSLLPVRTFRGVKRPKTRLVRRSWSWGTRIVRRFAYARSVRPRPLWRTSLLCRGAGSACGCGWFPFLTEEISCSPYEQSLCC